MNNFYEDDEDTLRERIKTLLEEYGLEQLLSDHGKDVVDMVEFLEESGFFYLDHYDRTDE